MTFHKCVIVDKKVLIVCLRLDIKIKLNLDRVQCKAL